MKTQVIPQKEHVLKTVKAPVDKRTEKDTYVMALCNRCGLLAFALLTGFFLIMKAFGLHEILAFRYFNVIFLAGCILMAFLLYRKKHDYKGIRYLTGIRMGIHVTLLGAILFSIFMGVYLAIDTGFMEYVQEHGQFGEFLTPVRAAGGVFIEGFASGAIITFSLMQLFKDEEFNPNYKN